MNDPTKTGPLPQDPDPSNKAQSDENAEKSLIQVAFPAQQTLVMSLAIGLGVVLIFGAGITKLFTAAADVQVNLLFAVGIGLILSAFGGQANVRWGPFVLAGITATTATIFWGLHKYESMLRDEFQKGYVQGTIKDFNPNLYNAKLRNKSYLMSRVDSSDWEFNFIVLMSELTQTQTRLLLTAKKKELVEKCKTVPAEQDCELVYIVGADTFRDAWRERRLIEWTFKPDGSLYDLKDNLVARVKETVEFIPDQPREAIERRFADGFWQFLRSAYASKGKKRRDLSEVKRALADLTSDDVDTRRAARDLLGDGPVEWVRPIADAFVEGFSNYRTKLGCLDALAQILRDEKSEVEPVRAQILDKHIDSLVASAGDSDRAVRVYAGEFLFDLGDKRTVLKALTLAAQSKDDNVRYNLIFVTQEGIKQLNESEQAEAAKLLSSLRGSGDKTNALIQKVQQSVVKSRKG